MTKYKVCQSFVVKLLQVPRATLFRAVNSAKDNPKAIDKRVEYPKKKKLVHEPNRSSNNLLQSYRCTSRNSTDPLHARNFCIQM